MVLSSLSCVPIHAGCTVSSLRSTNAEGTSGASLASNARELEENHNIIDSENSASSSYNDDEFQEDTGDRLGV